MAWRVCEEPNCGRRFQFKRGMRYCLCPCHAAYRRGWMKAKRNRARYEPTVADETEGRELIHRARARELVRVLRG